LQPWLQPQPQHLRVRTPPNRSHQSIRFFGQQSSGWQQVLQPHPQLEQPQLEQPQELAQPQLGAAAGAAHDASAAFSQAGAAAQDGAAAQQVFSQHFGWQQLLQPQQSRPSMRSSNSAPKLWPQRPTLRTSAPTNMFHFIEATSPYKYCVRTVEPVLGSIKLSAAVFRRALTCRGGTRLLRDNYRIGSAGKTP
jgi:hypothetical protein